MHIKLTEARLPFAPLLLIAPFFLWGTAMVAMKGTIAHTTPFFMTGIRLVPAGVLVLLAAALMGRPQPRGWRAWSWIALFALVDAALFQGFLGQGLVRTGAGLGSVMIDSQPLAVALMASWLFGEHIGGIGWLGLGFGVVGISLLGIPASGLEAARDWLLGQTTLTAEALNLWTLLGNLFQHGQWLMLMAALSMAVGTILIRFVSRHADPIVATGWHLILGGMPLFALSGWTETEQWTALTIADWSALAYATIFGSAIAYGLFFYLAASGNLTSLSALTFLTPVFALLFGNLLLQEVLTPLQWGGVGLTLISIYFINQREVLHAFLQRQWAVRFSGGDAARTPAVTQEPFPAEFPAQAPRPSEPAPPPPEASPVPLPLSEKRS